MPAANKKIFIIGCYRDDELDNQHPFKKMIGCCNDFDTNLTEIRLDCLGKDTVNRILSDLLSLSPCLVCGLSDIVYQKSKGSPLYMSQLLISLKRDGLLRLSLRDKRWVWDEARI
jgi:predicted ATPase